MSSWGKSNTAAQVVAGANTVAGLKYGHQPSEFINGYLANKRNIIATDKGWVRRRIKETDNTVRIVDEMLVPINGLANSTNLKFPDIAQIYFSSNSTGGSALANGTSANIYVVFNEPVFFKGGGVRLKLTVANTVSGNAIIARTTSRVNSNTNIVNANNTVVFKFVPVINGTYKVNAQVVANNTTGTSNLSSLNTGNEAANLTIVGAVSNAAGTFTVRRSTVA